jgi:hypothetical protein
MDLMPHLLQYLEHTKTIKEKSVCLDFMIQLLQDDPESLETKSIGLAVRLMGNLINDYYKDKSISLPALATMSLLKAKNSSAVLNCLLSIGPNILSRILELAGEIEPELQGSILKYIESVDDPLRKKVRHPAAKGISFAGINKVNLAELLADKDRINEAAEHLV